MTLWLTLAVNSIAFGGLLFLLSAGFSLIFGLMRIPNLMHGSFFMLGAYFGVTLLDKTRMNFWLAALISGAAMAVIGALIVYRVTRPPTARERVERVIPRGVMKDLRRARQTLELGLRRQVPPMRLYVGDKQLGEEKPSSQWERIAVNVARTAATAAASAVVARLVDQIKPGKASAEKTS